MKAWYREAAENDIIEQFRYYLTDRRLPEIALRFQESVELTVQFLCNRPLIGPCVESGASAQKGLRSWPVVGFEAIRIYYQIESESLKIVRILHGKRNIPRILRSELDP